MRSALDWSQKCLQGLLHAYMIHASQNLSDISSHTIRRQACHSQRIRACCLP